MKHLDEAYLQNIIHIHLLRFVCKVIYKENTANIPIIVNMKPIDGYGKPYYTRRVAGGLGVSLTKRERGKGHTPTYRNTVTVQQYK